jgi:hypothetical protein
MKRTTLDFEFVEFVPPMLEEGILYISIPYRTAVHRCCCGCGSKVVTPLAPTEWKLTFDGETISLNPSVGNWSFPCQSHYWIRRNRVDWSRKFSRAEIDAVRRKEEEERLGVAPADEEHQFDAGSAPARHRLKWPWRWFRRRRRS